MAFRFEDVRVPRHHALGAPGDGRGRAHGQDQRGAPRTGRRLRGHFAWIVSLVASRPAARGPPRQEGRFRTHAPALWRNAHGGLRGTLGRLPHRPAVRQPGRTPSTRASAAKVFASETANRIADMAIQLVGGEALVVGHPLEAVMRRLRSLRLAEGETDTLLVNVARGHLDLGKGRL
jgi:acyl-CoA dehydrogenase